MNDKLKEFIEFLFEYGNPSPSNICNLCVDFGFKRKEVQFTMQIGLERGLWHLDPNMHLAKGGLWDKK